MSCEFKRGEQKTLKVNYEYDCVIVLIRNSYFQIFVWIKYST